jgi:sugar phosphate isomerase/epimerase
MKNDQKSPSRRAFTRSALLAGGAGLLASAASQGELKIGLYSITYLGVWYRGDGLPLEGVIGRAKQFGYQGVEIDGKRPHGNPLDMPGARCRELRKAADGEGIEIYAVAANNDFSSPIPEHREAQLVYMRELIRMAADLRAPVVRVFFAWPGVTRLATPPGGGTYDIAKPLWVETHREFSAEQTWAWIRECLIESARRAHESGVTLALQNHPPVAKECADVLRMVREVASPSLKVCFDAGMEPNKDPEHIRKTSLEVGALQALAHFGGEFEDSADPAPYLAQVKGLLAAGYRGFIGYELCHPLPVVNGRTVGIEYADRCARLAGPFLRKVIAQAKEEPGSSV